MPKPMRCYECERFFARYACAVERGYDECDCPRCQGYCECHLLRAEQGEGRPENLDCEVCGGPLASDYVEADRSGYRLCYGCEKRSSVASREEQNQTYIDCGPQAWDDRDSESGDY